MLLEERASVSGSRTDEARDITIPGFAVRRRLMAVAKPRFARFGYEQVSVYDVTSAADLDQDDFQRYFRDKGSLLTAILDDGWQELLPRLKDVVATSITAHSGLLGVLALMTGALQKDQDLFRLFLLEGRCPDTKGGELGFSNGYRRFMQLCRDLVSRGQKDGSFRLTLHPHVAASMLMGAFEGMLRDRMVAEQERSTTPYTSTYMMPAFDALLWSLKN